MDETENEFRELEAELRRLRPLTPSAGLRAIVAQRIDANDAAPTRRRVLWWLAVPIGAAAALTLSWTRLRNTAPVAESPRASAVADAPATDSGFHPVAATMIPTGDQMEDYGVLADGTIVRGVRETYLTTITWQDPKTRAALTWSVPREEVRVEPVLFQ